MFLRKLMKKSIAILSCVLCIGIFSGCDNEEIEISNDDKIVETVGITTSEQITEELVLTNQELAQWTDNNEGVISGDIFEDNIFISDEVYMDIQNRLGEENAQQLSVFAENYEKWIPEEGETAG